MEIEFETLEDVLIAGKGKFLEYMEPTFSSPGCYVGVDKPTYEGIPVYTSGSNMPRTSTEWAILQELHRNVMLYKDWTFRITEVESDVSEEHVRYLLTVYASKKEIIAHTHRHFMENEDWGYDYTNMQPYEVEDIMPIAYTEKGSDSTWEVQVSYDVDKELEVTEITSPIFDFGILWITFRIPHSISDLIDNLKTTSMDDWLYETVLYTSDIDDIWEIIKDLPSEERVIATVNKYLKANKYEHYTLEIK